MTRGTARQRHAPSQILLSPQPHRKRQIPPYSLEWPRCQCRAHAKFHAFPRRQGALLLAIEAIQEGKHSAGARIMNQLAAEKRCRLLIESSRDHASHTDNTETQFERRNGGD